jgi:hypothetical protein
MASKFNPKSQSALTALPRHPRRSNPGNDNGASLARPQQLSPGGGLPRLGRSRSAQPEGPHVVPPLPPRPLTPQPPPNSYYQAAPAPFDSGPISFPEPQPYYGAPPQNYDEAQAQSLSPQLSVPPNPRHPMHRSSQSDEFLFYDQEITPQCNLPLPPVDSAGVS